jgi:hypothetical protein
MTYTNNFAFNIYGAFNTSRKNHAGFKNYLTSGVYGSQGVDSFQYEMYN